MCCSKLARDDADLCGIAELREELFAVFSGQAGCAFIWDANSGDGVPDGCEMSVVKPTFHQCGFIPARSGRAVPWLV